MRISAFLWHSRLLNRDGVPHTEGGVNVDGIPVSSGALRAFSLGSFGLICSLKLIDELGSGNRGSNIDRYSGNSSPRIGSQNRNMENILGVDLDSYFLP